MAEINPYEFRQTNGGQAQMPIQTVPDEKPTSVTVFGVLNCVFGGLGILCTPFSVLGLFIGDLIPMSEMNPIEISPGYKIFLLVASVIGIGVAAWLLSLGIGLLKFKSWARRGSVIYAWVAIVWGIVSAVINLLALSQGWMTAPQGQMPAMVSGMCGGMIGLIYPVLLLIFMQTKRVKEAFAAVGG